MQQRRRDTDGERELPPLPPGSEDKRHRQVKIRLSEREAKTLEARRPDLKVTGIIALLVDDVLEGRHNPSWMLPPGDADPQ